MRWYRQWVFQLPSKSNRRGREWERKGGLVQVSGRKYLLVLLSCNITPLKQIRKDKHTSRGDQSQQTHFWKSGLNVKLIMVKNKRVMMGAWRSDRAGPFEQSDSRQSGSERAEHWLRLQPEPPQYTQYSQYNVLLCCRAELLLQPGPFLPGGPQSRQKHTPKNNTEFHRGTQSAWVQWSARDEEWRVRKQASEERKRQSLEQAPSLL